MKNLDSEGLFMTFTAPSGGVVSGSGYLIGSLFVVALISADEGDSFTGRATGVFELPKTGSQAWTEGQKIYRNASTGAMDSDGSTGPLVGTAAEAVGSGAGETLGKVRLNGVPAEESEGQQAAISDLVAITGGESPTEAEHNLVVSKVNEILAMLRIKGDIAT